MSSITSVAKRAGVSITTVSRVLNNSPHPVGKEARERVLEAAKALNYYPNAVAKAMVTKSTRIIGVIVGDASDPYFATIVRSIADTARSDGYLTLVCNSDRIPDIEVNFARVLRDYRVDGVIFAGGGLTDENYMEQLETILDWFESNGVPVVTLGSHLFESIQVNIDNVQATLDMTEYLIQLGHRQIAYIMGPDGVTTSELRLQGYRKALEQYNVLYDPGLVYQGDFTYESGQEAAVHYLSRDSLPTAFFAANDISAIGCLTALQERGINVPEHASVVGFDNIASTLYTDPKLTTVDVPMRQMGVVVVEQILNIIKSKAEIESLHLLPHKLVIRGSSCPPP